MNQLQEMWRSSPRLDALRAASGVMTLDQIAEVRSGVPKEGQPQPHFYMIRKHDKKWVGKPFRVDDSGVAIDPVENRPARWSPKGAISVRIRPEHMDKVDPDGLFWFLHQLHSTGFWSQFSHGTLPLHNLRMDYVKGLPIRLSNVRPIATESLGPLMYSMILLCSL